MMPKEINLAAANKKAGAIIFLAGRNCFLEISLDHSLRD
jgi:hypothetical protein